MQSDLAAFAFDVLPRRAQIGGDTAAHLRAMLEQEAVQPPIEPAPAPARDFDGELRAVMRHSTDALFRRLVYFMAAAGARVGEAVQAEWNYLAGNRIELI